MPLINHLLIYFFAFAGIWIGSGLAIKSVERLSRRLRLSSFAVSFVILGFFTSSSELSVGINSIMTGEPEIYVGNLIGASIVLFMLITPLLAVVGHPIRINSELQGFNLPASLVVVALPVILALDGRIGRSDSLIAITLFALLLISIQRKRGLLERLKDFGVRSNVRWGRELVKTFFSLALIFVSSRFVVQETNYFAELFQVSPFLVSLLFIAVGTNVPELSLAVRSAFMRSNQVAFGNYVGSATFNTFLLGLLTFINGQPVQLSNSYAVSLLFLVVGLLLFYYFARTKNTLSRIEGLILLAVYVLFLLTEIYLHGGAELLQ